MHQDTTAFQHDILGLLADAPYSFAAIFGALRRFWHYPPDTDLAQIVAHLAEMEQHGWLTVWQADLNGSSGNRPATVQDIHHGLDAYTAWLPEAGFEELAVDDVGLWYQITDAGRAEWQHWSSGVMTAPGDVWMMDVDDTAQTIVIYASTREVAQEHLQAWLSAHPDTRVAFNSDRVAAVPSFTLRSGVTVSGGVRLTCRYQKHRGRKAS